jgi:hypothetical protein
MLGTDIQSWLLRFPCTRLVSSDTVSALESADTLRLFIIGILQPD